MDQPKIPTLKDAQKPQVKIKGMGAGVTLFDRLKQFKKKDLAFILAGLGTLFMAPLAEHFMMAPESGDAALQQGWGGGKGPGNNLFGSGSSPYENGNNNIAQGGAIGGAGDIITPLNVRDPSALVMGPGAAQQPNAGAVTPPAPPVTAPPSGGEDYKDALKGAASRAASAAVKRSPLPVPKVSLGGTNLRGLGVAGGGTSASGSLGPIGPAAGSNGVNGGGGGLGMVRGAPGFRGVAGARSPTGSGLDGTKKAGANAGDAFSRTGSALSGLNAAANEQIPTGGQGYGGGGGGGAGANDKGGGGSGPGGSKSVGESLAFIEAKERMMENLKLEFEKRKLKDPELLLYGIRNDMLKAAGVKVGEALTKTAMCKLMGSGCPDPDAEVQCRTGNRKASDLQPPCDKDKTKNCWENSNGVIYTWIQDGGGGDVCSVTGKKAGDAKPGSAVSGSSAAGPDRLGRVGPGGVSTGLVTNLNSVCVDLDGLKAKGGTVVEPTKTTLDGMRVEAAKLMTLSDALGGKTTMCDGVGKSDLLAGVPTLQTQQRAIIEKLQGTGDKDAGLVGTLNGFVTNSEDKGLDEAAKTAKELTDAAAKSKELLDKISAFANKSPKADTAELDNIAVEKGKIGGETKMDDAMYKGVISQARGDLKGKLSGYMAAQKLIDEKIIKSVNEIVGSGGNKGDGTLVKVVGVNSAYVKALPEAKAGADGAPAADSGVTWAKINASEQTGVDVKKSAILTAAENANAAVAKAQPVIKAIQDGSTMDDDKKAEAMNKKPEITGAKASVEGLRGAQRTWISMVKSDVDDASSKVPKVAPK